MHRAEIHKWVSRFGLIALVATVGIREVRSLPITAPTRHVAPSAAPPIVGEHRYRIAGKIRPLFFWIGRDNVGGARLTWRGQPDARAIALLIGTDSQHAPRDINEWGYILEEARNGTAQVFGVRSLTKAKSPDEAEATRAEGNDLQLFGALCSRVSATQDSTSTTTVRIQRDVTYRAFARLLDVIGAAVRWTRRDVRRPPGAQPGFLFAVERLIHDSIAIARHGQRRQTPASVLYVYKGVVYELRLARATPIVELRIGSSIFRDLIRGSFVIWNRTTHETTDFTVTYGAESPFEGVPVQATYQPHWWLKIELALDDRLEVPADPAADDAMRDRIHALCQSHNS